ncbi:unnamed protein product [Rotaria sp. Silwood2]|nr:unnamed protein product [Rotaria sp. Silwood2]CAF2943591.1 unnamed protein product [Rotaria sp. Silwood2]CAF3332478.1 unnamed protein product [Rotaria sp. Silwood2]CAF3989408.1 unnamed protein product [Rotaria sp. Silwood2]CAF4126341.1 unnamed protein product [Rotaria sp. Silwood2]
MLTIYDNTWWVHHESESKVFVKLIDRGDETVVHTSELLQINNKFSKIAAFVQLFRLQGYDESVIYININLIYGFGYALVNPDYHDENQKVIVRSHEFESLFHDPSISINANSLNSIQSSVIGLSLSNAFGVYAEFSSNQDVIGYSVTELHVKGT